MLGEDHHYRAALGLESEAMLRPQTPSLQHLHRHYHLCCSSGVIDLALIGVLIGVILCRNEAAWNDG